MSAERDVSSPLPTTPPEVTTTSTEPLDSPTSSKRDEWLVNRAYLSAESISLVLADPEKSSLDQIKEEVPELQAA